MDVILKGRGIEITEQLRRRTEHKLAKIARLEPRVRRLEVEIIAERNPRIDGKHRVHVSADIPRHVIRAEAAGHDVDSALDRVVERLERQVATYRGKLRNRREPGPLPYNPAD